MAAFLGIDLGTTYSAISYIDDTGRPKIIHNSEGANITPSCIDFSAGKRNAEVGEEARKSIGLSDKIASRFKRDMGTSKIYKINGDEHTPTDCSGILLKKLWQDAKKAIGEIGETVVTTPANFSNEARSATLESAKMAGLKVKNIVNEPTAAALYYAFKSGEEMHGNYAVYDLGGGTFDVTIIKADAHDVDVITSSGISRLGGDDFDIVLQDIVRSKFKEATGDSLDESDYTKTDAEDDKKSLSKRESINVRVAKKNILVLKTEFEQKISTLVAQTEMLCESVIDEAGLKASDIKEVFLAGGSTRIPMVTDSVRRAFKKDPTASVNVDEVVALGASLFCAFKGDKSKLSATQKKSIEKIKVVEATTKCFGTIALNPDDNKDYVDTIIHKNAKIPCSVTKSFYTISANQREVSCTITESESPETDPIFVTILHKENLPLPEGRDAGKEVQVKYSFDENQVMHAVFKDIESGNVKEAKIDSFSKKEKSSSKVDEFIVE